MTTDDALLLRVAQRDGDALVELDARWRRWIASLVYARFAWLAQEIEDVRQEIALRIWKGAPSYRSRGNGAGWIKTLAWNICLDRARQSAYHAERTPWIPQPAAPPDVLTAMASAEAARQLEEVARTVSDSPAWQARINDPEMRVADMPAMLDMPLGTCKTHLYRARQRLYRQMGAVRATI